MHPGVTEGCRVLRRHVVGIGGAVCAPADAVVVTVKPAAAVSAPNIPSKNVRRSIAVLHRPPLRQFISFVAGVEACAWFWSRLSQDAGINGASHRVYD